jgi:hypothetical protein
MPMRCLRFCAPDSPQPMINATLTPCLFGRAERSRQSPFLITKLNQNAAISPFRLRLYQPPKPMVMKNSS